MRRGAKTGVVSLGREDGTVVCPRCTVAATPLRRMKGLLGRKELPPGEGLLLRPGSSIHMFFMRFPIDAVFLDREHVVRKVVPDLKPWRLASARGAKSVVELAAGEAARRGIAPGQRLTVDEIGTER
jgi:uncharacterized membrane protein (UPF0127 family)